jgi:hypothetical protein
MGQVTNSKRRKTNMESLKDLQTYMEETVYRITENDIRACLSEKRHYDEVLQIVRSHYSAIEHLAFFISEIERNLPTSTDPFDNWIPATIHDKKLLDTLTNTLSFDTYECGHDILDIETETQALQVWINHYEHGKILECNFGYKETHSDSDDYDFDVEKDYSNNLLPSEEPPFMYYLELFLHAVGTVYTDCSNLSFVYTDPETALPIDCLLLAERADIEKITKHHFDLAYESFKETYTVDDTWEIINQLNDLEKDYHVIRLIHEYPISFNQ